MTGTATQPAGPLFPVVPVDGETRVIAGVPCTLEDGIYSGSRDGLTVAARRTTDGERWLVRVEVGSTVLVDSLDDVAGLVS